MSKFKENKFFDNKKICITIVYVVKGALKLCIFVIIKQNLENLLLKLLVFTLDI